MDLYDLENTDHADIDFSVRLADVPGARQIIDLGCGTGVPALALANQDRDFIGVNPAAAMLDYARRQNGCELVRWIRGDSSVPGKPHADLVLMEGNVSQVFLEDDEEEATLRDIHAALRPGGHLAFEGRDSADQSRTRWNRDATYAQFDSPRGPVETWLEVEAISRDTGHLAGHNRFLTTGEIILAWEMLRFRSKAEWTASQIRAGFTVERTVTGMASHFTQPTPSWCSLRDVAGDRPGSRLRL